MASKNALGRAFNSFVWDRTLEFWCRGLIEFARLLKQRDEDFAYWWLIINPAIGRKVIAFYVKPEGYK